MVYTITIESEIPIYLEMGENITVENTVVKIVYVSTGKCQDMNL